MKRTSPPHPISHFFREQTFPFLKENTKVIAQFLFTLFFIGLGIWFVKHEQTEIHEVKRVLSNADPIWMAVGVLFTVLYIYLQGFMYVASFEAVGGKIAVYDAVVLFLKRNLVSIFLPAGGISSLAFFSGDIENKGSAKHRYILPRPFMHLSELCPL